MNINVHLLFTVLQSLLSTPESCYSKGSVTSLTGELLTTAGKNML